VPVEAPGSWSRPTGEGVRTWRYKYLTYADGTAELYDLVTDPYELHNVIGVEAYRSVRSAMRSLLQERKACRGDGCRIPAPSQLQG
jgi:N-acetylglucosamine-6-sulfatase